MLTSDRKSLVKEDYALVPLGSNAKGGYAKISVEDRWVDKHYWTNHKGKAEGNVNGKYTNMSRTILNAPKGMEVDHINHDLLDNRRSNLRICTPTENARNKRKYKSGKFPYKGVSMTGSGKYKASVKVMGRANYLGVFEDMKDAARAYDIAARKHFGEFAFTNFKENTN